MTTMHPHVQGLRVRPRHLRSANLEHDLSDGMNDYVLTGRALDLLRRVVQGTVDPDTTRAWAVTGPYGAGKSSFAMLLTVLLCRSGSEHEDAVAMVAAADADLAERINALTEAGPVLRAAATARREPVYRTVTRALQAAARDDSTLARGLGELDLDHTHPRKLVDLVVAVTSRRPLLIVLDEFGKNLEYFTEDAADGDVFLLQEFAELAAGTRTRHPLSILTLQHAPYADYLSGAGAVQRREWRKVQGRFIDVSYTEGPADVAAIVAGTLVHDLPPRGQRALSQYGKLAEVLWSSLGLTGVLAADAALLQSVYPIHPVVLASLPALCATLGQHDRTLTGFLTDDEPHTLARYLDGGRTAVVPAVLGTLRLDTVYDYFVGTVSELSGRGGSRWVEITGRVDAARERDDLDEQDVGLLKAAGLLNVVGSGGALRASLGVLTLAVADPQDVTDAHRQVVAARCDRLIERGFLTYRRHDDEYRVWAGTDIDIESRVMELREQVPASELASFVTTDYLPVAVVAGRHSQEHGLLRHFQPVVLPSLAPLTARKHGTRPDGFIGYNLGDASTGENAVQRPPLPLLIGTSDDAAAVRAAAGEALALGRLFEASDLDPVARAEVRDRFTSAKAALAATITAAFDPDSNHAHWTLLLPGQGDPVPMERCPSMSALVSAAADAAFSQSPHIRSEMLGRHQLTSQGAKARREVLTALLQHPHLEKAGLSGNGPDVAIYHGVVSRLGLHGRLPGTIGEYGWTTPGPGDPGNAYPAFERITSQIEATEHGITLADLAEHLSAPPFGVKAGVFPLLLTAVVCTNPDIALFEDGTFQTVLSPDLVERMVKTPGRFQLQHTPTGQGQPAALIAALGDALDLDQRQVRAGTRNPNVVRVAAALLGHVTNLSDYARRTRDLSQEATALRSALLEARDPTALLLRELPIAVGQDPVDVQDAVDLAAAERIASAVRQGVDEVRGADAALRDNIVGALGASLSPPEEDPARVRASLADLATGITSASGDPVLRGLVQHCRQGALDDDDWFAQAAMIITNQPPPQWRREQVEAFAPTARRLVRAMERLYALHVEDHLGQSVRRLTLTSADGGEEHLVVQSGTDPDVDRLLDGVLAAAHSSLGLDAERRLLGALAVRTLTPTND